ncbi:hypothetical protein PBRA_008414 [Plasmodiophora brassicae]|uniref:DUF4218 domain-containing protein n=1 Tax=Plasmodiophora brassicae TaxID=37360 RepID=A0A0G4J0U7_PLABS|nr:hypothetical protein PBRA_008414 [Plasmodiophora brassicae]
MSRPRSLGSSSDSPEHPGGDASRDVNIFFEHVREYQRRRAAADSDRQRNNVAAGNRFLEIARRALSERRNPSVDVMHNPFLRLFDEHRRRRQRRPTMTVTRHGDNVSVEPFDIRPALLENNARSNVQEFNEWRETNCKEYMNELRLSDFLVAEISKKLEELEAPNIDPTILDNFDEIASNRAKESRIRRNALIRDICEAKGVPSDDFTDALDVDLNATAESISVLRRHLLDMGVTSPFIRYKACCGGHVWPDGADVPSSEACCRQSEPCIYFSRILFLQCLFRSNTFCKMLHDELDRHREIASAPLRSTYMQDWTDGDFFYTVYSPFMKSCLENGEFPLSLSSMIDGADLLSWGSKSVVPLVQIVMGLPASVRCNQGLMSPVALIPNVAKGHRRAVQRLDAFELNLMNYYGFPVFDAVEKRVKHVRCISAVMPMDYIELCHTSCTSQNGKQDACNKCSIRGRSANRSVKYHGAFMFASSDVQRHFCKKYEDMLEYLDALPSDKRPSDVRSLDQLRDDVRCKDDDEVRRRMTSRNVGDRGGYRHPGYDVYSVGLLCSFGHASNYVHDPMHAICMRAVRPLFQAIDFYGSGSSYYNPETEKLFGRGDCPSPVWAWPNNTAYPAKVKAGVKWSSLAVEIDHVLENLTWVSRTGGSTKPRNPLVSSWWKAADSLVWLGDVGIGIWWSVVSRVLVRTRPDSPIASFWIAMFRFLDALSSMLSKAFVRSNLDRVFSNFLDALAHLESVMPCGLMTISMHSLVHLPEIIKRWGPLVGLIWVWPMERWLHFMKDVLQATVSETVNIASYMQLICAATFLRSDFYRQYSLRNDCPLMFGNATGMDEIPTAHLSTLPIDLRPPLSSVELNDTMRCWLHVHLYSNTHWASTKNHSWRVRYRRLVALYAQASGNPRGLNSFSGMFRHLGSFDLFCSLHKSSFGSVCLPKSVQSSSRADIGRCMFRKQDVDESYKTCNSKFVVEFEEAGLYMGDISNLVKLDLGWSHRLAHEADSICLILVGRWYKLHACDKPYDRVLPRFYPNRNGWYNPGSADTMWQALHEVVPNNIVTVPASVIHNNAVVQATMVCIESRGNMTAETLQSTIARDIGAAV